MGRRRRTGLRRAVLRRLPREGKQAAECGEAELLVAGLHIKNKIKKQKQKFSMCRHGNERPQRCDFDREAHSAPRHRLLARWAHDACSATSADAKMVRQRLALAIDQ